MHEQTESVPKSPSPPLETSTHRRSWNWPDPPEYTSVECSTQATRPGTTTAYRVRTKAVPAAGRSTSAGTSTKALDTQDPYLFFSLTWMRSVSMHSGVRTERTRRRPWSNSGISSTKSASNLSQRSAGRTPDPKDLSKSFKNCLQPRLRRGCLLYPLKVKVFLRTSTGKYAWFRYLPKPSELVRWRQANDSQKNFYRLFPTLRRVIISLFEYFLARRVFCPFPEGFPHFVTARLRPRPARPSPPP